MAQFDVHRLGDGLVVDCQSNLLADLNTRFVAPLVRSEDAPAPARRLNPVFAIDETDHVMQAQFASAVERRHLSEAVASLADHSFEIIDALDVLISGV